MKSSIVSGAKTVSVVSDHAAAVSPYNDEADQAAHQCQIERLADEINCELKDITPLYENILLQMKNTARIHDYLPVLVSKRVKHWFKSLR